MPLETREDYVRLNQHLWEIDTIVSNFASDNGYEYGPPLKNGLYPKIRLRFQRGRISQNINIDMDTDIRDQRFGEFFPEIPYTIFGGSWIDDHAALIRHGGPHLHTLQIPFSQLKLSIHKLLPFFHQYLCTVTEKIIYGCGTQSELSAPP
ncbi:hypothetical protein FEM03_19635 [Phragmitibacter flavus]|uniref:Uncharacterized protein n=1 Tax=Phragmitibacter flavus TaxID=2576071 RepID=A0A5R8K9V1_9BACT|nr:hypothetical protein [Phragmitibacter flavus]TLD69081.1 hypothetical protein FEM03_19635 [Phragmitibacter flavus]